MAEKVHGTGGLTFDASKRQWPNELNIFGALVLIVLILFIQRRPRGLFPQTGRAAEGA